MGKHADNLDALRVLILEAVETSAAVDPLAIPDQKPLISALRKLISVLQEFERARARTGQVGRPVIFHGDDEERERYREYLENGMGSRQIEKAGIEPYSRATIAVKLKKYSEELGIKQSTFFKGSR